MFGRSRGRFGGKRGLFRGLDGLLGEGLLAVLFKQLYYEDNEANKRYARHCCCVIE